MKKFEHLNFEYRKMINNQITSHKAKAVDIANIIFILSYLNIDLHN